MKPIHYILICCLLGLSLGGYSQKKVEMDSTTKHAVIKMQQKYDDHKRQEFTIKLGEINPIGEYSSIKSKRLKYTLLLKSNEYYKLTYHTKDPAVKRASSGKWIYGKPKLILINVDDEIWAEFELSWKEGKIEAKCKWVHTKTSRFMKVKKNLLLLKD